MKIYLNFVLLLLCCNLSAQNSRTLEIPNSNYVVVKYLDFSKDRQGQSGLKFIDTQTGNITDVLLAEQTSIKKLEYVKLDVIGINAVLVITERVQKKSGGFNIESTILLYSIDGKLINKATIDQHISDFVINTTTGKIVLLLGENHFKTGSKSIAQSEIIYDLKTLKKI